MGTIPRDLRRQQANIHRAVGISHLTAEPHPTIPISMARTRILIVDDSALMRQLLAETLGAAPDLEVVGTAADPYVAWERIKQLEPDVITLDVEMPRMDGLTFLERLMHLRPMPVLMVSSLTEQGCATTLRALELGAVDFVTKPQVDMREGTIALADELQEKVRVAARSRVRTPVARRSPAGSVTATPPRFAAPRPMLRTTNRIIAIGASTGGTEALREVLEVMPPDAPPIIMVQHMPEGFTTSFAARLDSLCQIAVREARDGDRLQPGLALLAPGNHHVSITRSGATYVVNVSMGAPVNRHRPSVDVLFSSCARAAGANAVGVILTGMGDDGARGMAEMRKAGAHTVAQNEQTCVVFGMPRAAIEHGGVIDVRALQDIPQCALRAAG